MKTMDLMTIVLITYLKMTSLVKSISIIITKMIQRLCSIKKRQMKKKKRIKIKKLTKLSKNMTK